MSEVQKIAEKDKTKTFKLKLMRAVTAFLVVFVVLIISLIIYIMVAQSRGEVPFIGNYAWLRIDSPSMEDTLPVDNFILIKKVSPDNIKSGDIITFYSDDPEIKGYPNTHRVVDVENIEDGQLLFTTKGDNNSVVDTYKVQDDKVIGIYVRQLYFVSSVSSIFRSKSAFLLLIVPALVLVAFSAKDVINTTKNIKKEKNTDELVRAEVERLKNEARNQKNSDDENNQT